MRGVVPDWFRPCIERVAKDGQRPGRDGAMPEQRGPKRVIDLAMRILGGLLLLSALTKIRLLTGFWAFPQLWAKVLAAGFFLSAALGAYGLFRLRAWGFFFVYAYIVTATYFFSISVVPFLYPLLSLTGISAAVMLIAANLGVLVAAVLLHAAKARLPGTVEAKRGPGRRHPA